MKALIAIGVRLILTAGLIVWIAFGSKIALVIFCSFTAIAVELLNITSPSVTPDLRKKPGWW